MDNICYLKLEEYPNIYNDSDKIIQKVYFIIFFFISTIKRLYLLI